MAMGVQSAPALDQPAALLLPMAGRVFGSSWRKTPNGLTATQAKALLFLTQQDGQLIGQLAQQLGCVPSVMTGIIDHLESAGLVERRRDIASDRRAVALYLTEHGRQAVVNAPSLLQQQDEALLASLEPQERACLLEVLPKVIANLERADRAS
jgi:DNA-binding MarR family transcriptional regulator